MITQTDNKIQIDIELPEELKNILKEVKETINQETTDIILQDTQVFLNELTKLFSQFIDIKLDKEK